MIGLVQRVTGASVEVNSKVIGEIGPGLLVLVGFRAGDRTERIGRFVERLLNYRVFPDAQGRMNRSLRQVDGALLLVPQFTLAADTNSGNRPSFTPAASPEDGRVLFDQLIANASSVWTQTARGQFGADMQVKLTNDGPVTFWLEVD
ncbi:MAG TPA: D-aminoacyl-tRNA deacylase [Wenzhouxiangella sp.]|nr:D-aminoacyl-tRNA deacylase [Wenzhouxiangella sp.]